MHTGVGTTTVDLDLIDGTRLRLTVPDLVGMAIQGATVGDLHLSGSAYVDFGKGQGWRLDVAVGSIERFIPDGEPVTVPPPSNASAARMDRAGHRLGLQFGTWAVVVSGDSLTDEEISTVLDAVSFVETPDGLIEYRGTLALWVADSPDLSLSRQDTTVSAFLRECPERAVQPTATGLMAKRFDGASRGSKLTVLCDLAQKVEISLDTQRPLTDQELDRVKVEVLSIGPTLARIQRGEHP